MFLLLPPLLSEQPSPYNSNSNPPKREPNLVFKPAFGRCFHAGWLDGPAAVGRLPLVSLAVTPASEPVVRIQAPRQASLPLWVECSQLQVRQYPNTRNQNTRRFSSSHKRSQQVAVLRLRGSVTLEDQALHIFRLCQVSGQCWHKSMKNILKIPLIAPRGRLKCY